MINTTPSDFRLQTSFLLKILFKILVQISSRRRSKINPFPKARNSSAFSVEIFLLKILFLSILNDILFLAKQHLIKDFPQRFLAKQPQKNPRNTRSTRILVKDSCKDYSLDFEPQAIHNKTLPKSEVLERILVKDFY